MTLAAAFRSMGRIVVMSDTMITDQGFLRPNQIPGRLKSVVLNTWLTVTYAGLSTQALDAIRRLCALPSPTTELAISYLHAEAAKFPGEIDFLLCSHEEPTTPRLIQLRDGRVSEGLDLYWIGNQESARRLSRLDLPPIDGERGSDYYSIEETRFARRFHEYLGRSGDPAIGGMAINCLASPFGHCYQDHLGSYVERITIPDTVDPALRAEMNRAGMNGYYSYAVLAPPQRGVAIVGVYFEQACLGFVHEPLVADDPEGIKVDNQRDFQQLLRDRARVALEARDVG